MIADEVLAEKFKSLHQKIREYELSKRPTSQYERAQRVSVPRAGLGAMRASLTDIQLSIATSNLTLDLKRKTHTEPPYYDNRQLEKHTSPYIKIVLTKTADLLLYEQRSATAIRDSEEGRLVEADNKLYEYLTEGKGTSRSVSKAETQTTSVLYKTRDANTETILNKNVGSYVSNFEMFDTYKDLEKSTKSVDVDGMGKFEITTYTVAGVDQFLDISEMPNFKLAVMLTLRILAGNVFEKQQRRFRNMQMPDPLSEEVHYKYRMELLWRFDPQFSNDGAQNAVSDVSWCPRNGDLLAVAYGIYSYSGAYDTNHGSIYVWNIKNPVNPERSYHFNAAVLSVEFSPFVPQLIAIGLYDGSVEVRDITDSDYPPVAVSQHSPSRGCEPIIAIKWLPQNKDGCETTDVESFLALSRNGSVTKFRIINSPYLLGYQQITLDRVEGCPEGLSTERDTDQFHAERHPQGLRLSLSPQHTDIFYVLTGEGCIHKCSTYYTHQHLEVCQVHEAGVNSMEFSPWSPKLFLTCGNDWCVHIWMEGIFKPLITLKHRMGPIHCAYWSKTHSTIIIALNRTSIDIWDIRISTLKPVSSTTIGASFYTLCKLSNCGRSVAVGNEQGEVLMMALEDMPFPPFFQYKQLRSALFKAISIDADLKQKINSFGYFGYPEKEAQH